MRPPQSSAQGGAGGAADRHRPALAAAGPSLSVLSVSPFAERVIARFIPGQHRRFVLHSPIDAALDEPVAAERNTGFVFVGRVIAEKGVRQLARAARQSGLPVKFVGDGPLLEEIRAMGEPVHCTGWLDANAVRKTVRGARALVFPLHLV